MTIPRFKTVLEIPHELIQIWEAAVKASPTKDSPFTINTGSKGGAVNLSAKLYSARKLCIEEKYPGSANWNQLQISRHMPKEGWLSIYLPGWMSGVREKLKEEGVEPMKVENLSPYEAVVDPALVAREASHSAETLQVLFGPKEEQK